MYVVHAYVYVIHTYYLRYSLQNVLLFYYHVSPLLKIIVPVLFSVIYGKDQCKVTVYSQLHGAK